MGRGVSCQDLRWLWSCTGDVGSVLQPSDVSAGLQTVLQFWDPPADKHLQLCFLLLLLHGPVRGKGPMQIDVGTDQSTAQSHTDQQFHSARLPEQIWNYLVKWETVNFNDHVWRRHSANRTSFHVADKFIQSEEFTETHQSHILIVLIFCCLNFSWYFMETWRLTLNSRR